MRQYSWDEFYEKFYDWAESTQKQYARSLANFGDESEVAEIVLELFFDDETLARDFLARAMQAGVRFKPKSVMDLMYDVDQDVLQEMVAESPEPFSKEDLKELESYVDDKTYRKAARRAGVAPEEDRGVFSPMVHTTAAEASYPGAAIISEEIAPPPERRGFWAALFGTAGTDRTRHNGRCSGDCANCPPHYGYRYGRWYYGHSHSWGCEFGGNKGDGGRD